MKERKLFEPFECHCQTNVEHLPPIVGHDLLLPIYPPYKDDQSPKAEGKKKI